MQKVYVLDSSVLLHDPNAMFRFEDNEVIVPFAVLEEIENTKRFQDSVGQAARQAIRHLDQLRRQGQLSEGVTLDGGGKLRIELNHISGHVLPLLSDPGLTDNRIITVCINLAAEEERPVILVTKDIAMRVKADALGVMTQDYYNDKVLVPSSTDDVVETEIDDEQVKHIYEKGYMEVTQTFSPNSCVKALAGEHSAIPLVSSPDGEKLLFRVAHNQVTWGILPKNTEQSWALHMLNNPEIQLVNLMGPAGTGKTLLALASGLEQTIHEGLYATVLCARPIVPFGKDIGYLPGEKENKVRPYMQPIYDNLELLLRPKREKGKERENGSEAIFDSTLDMLKKKKQLDIEVLTYIRGRSIPNQFMIIDEAQNLSVHEIKTIITRAGEGTKIVLCGDQDQIDHPYLDKQSNGLAHVASRLKGQAFYAQVWLTQGERSELASKAADLL